MGLKFFAGFALTIFKTSPWWLTVPPLWSPTSGKHLNWEQIFTSAKRQTLRKSPDRSSNFSSSCRTQRRQNPVPFLSQDGACPPPCLDSRLARSAKWGDFVLISTCSGVLLVEGQTFGFAIEFDDSSCRRNLHDFCLMD